MDDADQGMEASAATIRDSVRRKNAVTLNHQQAIYTEKLRPSGVPTGWCSFFYVFECSATGCSRPIISGSGGGGTLVQMFGPIAYLGESRPRRHGRPGFS